MTNRGAISIIEEHLSMFDKKIIYEYIIEVEQKVINYIPFFPISMMLDTIRLDTKKYWIHSSGVMNIFIVNECCMYSNEGLIFFIYGLANANYKMYLYTKINIICLDE